MPTSTFIDVISQFSFDIIAKLSASYLESFVRIRVQKNLLETWKAPTKGSKKKIEEGLICKQTKGKFLVQLVKDLASIKPIAEEPDLPDVELPTCLIPKPSVFVFQGPSGLESFTANKDWCLAAASAIKSIQHRGLVDTLLEDMDGLNSSACLFARKIISRLPSFVIPRVPPDRSDLHPGRHWHWDSLMKKLQRISILCVMSGHIPCNLHLRGAHESYLKSNNDAFLEVKDGMENLEGNYLSEDVPRATIHRSGATEHGFASRWKEHQRASLLRNSSEKQRRYSLLYPDTTKAAGVEGRMGTFQDLKQRVGLGMERTKRDEIIALFNWDEDEENELKKLSWTSCWPDNLENRKYKHLTYLFEATYAISVTPSFNITQNTTSEWELRYYG